MTAPKDKAAPHAPQPATGGQGIVRDERGQEQPQDEDRAKQVSREDKDGDPPAHPNQKH
jgi:hypothetical protein